MQEKIGEKRKSREKGVFVMLKTPVLIVNFKAYTQANGEELIKIAQTMEECANAQGVSCAIAVPSTDIYRVSQAVKMPILAEHIDPVKPGAATGHQLAGAAKTAGAVGSLLNHSECRMKIADLESAIQTLKSLQMTSIVCTNNIATSAAAAILGPDFVAVEPPELIGGDISVSTAQPEIVSGTVEAIRKVNPAVKVLCGAGVKNGIDVQKSIELGAEGVLLASGIVKAKDVKAATNDILSGYK